MMDPLLVNRDMNLLATFVRDRAITAIKAANADGFNIAVFEGWRSPERQLALYSQGRETPGKIVTNSHPWESWHQYSIAVDIAFHDGNTWSWHGPFDKIEIYFTELGFRNLKPFEQCHFDITGGIHFRDAKHIYDTSGIQVLWSEIENGL